jgi:hypothetical protein
MHATATTRHVVGHPQARRLGTRCEKIPRLRKCQRSVVVARLGLSDSIYHHGQTTDDGSVTEGDDVLH